MGESPAPLARPLVVRAAPPPAPSRMLEWLERSRSVVERVPAHPLVATAPDGDAIRTRADEDGFVFLPRLLPETRLAPLRALIDAELSRRGWVVDGRSDPALRFGRWNDTRWLDFLGVVLASAPYRALAAAPELRDVLRPILGDDLQLHVGDVCRLVSPGALDLTTPPHQDAAYLKEWDGVWTAWMPLVPCPIELGPLALLPASHRAGLKPHARVETGDDQVVGAEVPPDAPWRSLDLELGDVLLFSSLTMHRALPNVTPDRLRVSVDFRYRPAR
jgi:hypothetical protein